MGGVLGRVNYVLFYLNSRFILRIFLFRKKKTSLHKGHALFGSSNTDRVVYIHLCLIFSLCLLYRATDASILVKFVSISTDRKAQKGLTLFWKWWICLRDGVIYLVNRTEKGFFLSKRSFNKLRQSVTPKSSLHTYILV